MANIERMLQALTESVNATGFHIALGRASPLRVLLAHVQHAIGHGAISERIPSLQRLARRSHSCHHCDARPSSLYLRHGDASSVHDRHTASFAPWLVNSVLA
jgi:hypothetical protein